MQRVSKHWLGVIQTRRAGLLDKISENNYFELNWAGWADKEKEEEHYLDGGYTWVH